MGYLAGLGRGKMQGEVESHGVVLGAETQALAVQSPLGVKGTKSRSAISHSLPSAARPQTKQAEGP